MAGANIWSGEHMQQTAPLESHHAPSKRFPPAVNTAGKLLAVWHL